MKWCAKESILNCYVTTIWSKYVILDIAVVVVFVVIIIIIVIIMDHSNSTTFLECACQPASIEMLVLKFMQSTPSRCICNRLTQQLGDFYFVSSRLTHDTNVLTWGKNGHFVNCSQSGLTFISWNTVWIWSNCYKYF